MVGATRARSYETDRDGSESRGCRPAKRRRLESKPPSSRCDACEVTPPSLCASRSSTSEDSAHQRVPGLGLPSNYSITDSVPPAPCDFMEPVLEIKSGEREADSSRAGNESDHADLREQKQTVLGEILRGDHSKLPGSSISPPRALQSPREFVYEDVINPHLGEEVQRAYEASRLRESFRRSKYGARVAKRWKHGWTPEEVRTKWRSIAARQRAQAEEYSDSD